LNSKKFVKSKEMFLSVRSLALSKFGFTWEKSDYARCHFSRSKTGEACILASN